MRVNILFIKLINKGQVALMFLALTDTVAFGGGFYIEPNFLSSEILIVPPKKIEKN